MSARVEEFGVASAAQVANWANPKADDANALGAADTWRAEDFDYCQFFCEENCWRMVQRLVATIKVNEQNLAARDALVAEKCKSETLEPWVILITSKSQMTPIWYQKSSKGEDDFVLWDYHVVVLLNGEIFDFDSKLSFPTLATKYIEKAFRPGTEIRDENAHRFRVMAGREYLLMFASDRSHMAHVPIKDHPHWAPIKGSNAKVGHTLPALLNIEDMITVNELASLPQIINKK